MPKRPISLAMLVLALALGPLPAMAADEPPWNLSRLMADLARVERTQARFTERKYLKVLKAPLDSSGTLAFTAPSRLEKRTLKPKPEALVIDGATLTVETGKDSRRHTLQLQDHPVLWAFVESIRATLAGDLATLDRFYKVDLEGDAGRWQLYLVPRERGMVQVISQIRIGGSRARIELIEVQETQGNRSVMKISEGAP